MSQLSYSVPEVHCAHCERAISDEVSKIDGIEAVEVDLERKVVTVRGKCLSDQALRAAIFEAGYEVA